MGAIQKATVPDWVWEGVEQRMRENPGSNWHGKYWFTVCWGCHKVFLLRRTKKSAENMLGFHYLAGARYGCTEPNTELLSVTV